jgi:hypothetical protein
MPAWIPLVGAGLSLAGSLMGSRSASKQQKEANALNKRAQQFAEQQYADRGQFRDFATSMMGGLGGPVDLWGYGGYNPDLEFTRYAPLGEMSQGRARALADVMDSPDRMALTKQRIADLDAAGEQDLERRFRRVGQRAATLGRVGAAGVTTELGTLQADYERDRQAQINELIRQTTDLDVNDRFRRLGAVASEDDANYGRRVDDFSRRDTLGRNSLEERVRRWNAERGVQGEDISRMLAIAGLGYGYDPSGVLAGLGNSAQRRADGAASSASQAWNQFGQSAYDWWRNSQG